jgi:hypothetical protein
MSALPPIAEFRAATMAFFKADAAVGHLLAVVLNEELVLVL